jgi:hypothetical protein
LLVLPRGWSQYALDAVPVAIATRIIWVDRPLIAAETKSSGEPDYAPALSATIADYLLLRGELLGFTAIPVRPKSPTVADSVLLGRPKNR